MSTPSSFYYYPHPSTETPITLDVINVLRYYCPVIRSFRDKETQRLFNREVPRKLPEKVQKAGLRKLVILDAAESLQDLSLPPGNRLEKLPGDRAGQHSIRINEQWQICFRWNDGEADDVEITDYH